MWCCGVTFAAVVGVVLIFGMALTGTVDNHIVAVAVLVVLLYVIMEQQRTPPRP